jgi:hypothetical protein
MKDAEARKMIEAQGDRIASLERQQDVFQERLARDTKIAGVIPQIQAFLSYLKYVQNASPLFLIEFKPTPDGVFTLVRELCEQLMTMERDQQNSRRERDDVGLFLGAKSLADEYRQFKKSRGVL